ncbi:MAG: hypothetical protein K0B81_05905 [Candidatus Cloacimonetes bacterium]|nr:hypothetical protein [Candidatus Cloacimonadota bacterium]
MKSLREIILGGKLKGFDTHARFIGLLCILLSLIFSILLIHNSHIAPIKEFLGGAGFIFGSNFRFSIEFLGILVIFFLSPFYILVDFPKTTASFYLFTVSKKTEFFNEIEPAYNVTCNQRLLNMSIRGKITKTYFLQEKKRTHETKVNSDNIPNYSFFRNTYLFTG